MKSLIVSRKIAIASLFMVICLSSVAYFISASEIMPVNSWSCPYKPSAFTLIIDPGHGGADGGAVSPNGTVESEINLAISLKLELLCAFLGISTEMTRTSAEIKYPPEANSIRAKKIADQKSRVDLINKTERAVLVSIHQNYYTSSSPSGAQVLYAATLGSKEFAEYMQSIILQSLTPGNRRVASLISDKIYIMNKINCPAVLLECGFISNPAEERLLKSAEYQLKIAAVIGSCCAEHADNF